ncbi:MAG: ABC transporter substrate-binding protein, partial [Thermotogota bacterium]
MKKCVLLVVCFSLVLSLTFGQVAEEIAVAYIESKGIISDCTTESLTYEAFYSAVESAFPGTEIPFEPGLDEVLRKDFIANLVKIMDLEDEALAFEEAYTWANDERIIPDAFLPYFTLAYQSDKQLLDYRYGQLAAPFEAITKIEAARAFYSAIFQPQQGGQVVSAVTADPPGFNTLFTSSGLTWTLCNILGDGYLGTNEDGFYIPRMIKEIPTVENGLIQMLDNGGMAITYNVRKGMKWHDGEEITAHDAHFQWEVMLSDAPVTSNYYEKMVQKVEVNDDYSFTIYFDQPMSDGKFGSSVYGYYFGWFQLPEHVYRDAFEEAKDSGKWDAFANDITRNPVLSGPYKLKEYKEGQHVVLEAFDEYYMGRPNIDTVIFRIIPDSDSIFASTLNGEIDVGRYTLDLKQSLQLKNQKSDVFNVFLTPNVAYQCIDLNYRDPEDLSKPNPLFSDVRVRQAFLYGLNREQINQIVFQGEAEIVDTWITELHMMREALKDPAIKHYEYNPAKA